MSKQGGASGSVGGRAAHGVNSGGSIASGSVPGSTSTAATRVMSMGVQGGFRGSSAQAAHIEAVRKANIDAAREKTSDSSTVSDVAVRPGLGLKALEERKRKEEEERQAKRDKAREDKLNQVSRKKIEDGKALIECEEHAWCDSEANGRVKYEAALIVRIATCFGASGVWVKIAEARARGAEIPLDPKRIYLLAHPDKWPLELRQLASDATAVLNEQRPPEMSESTSASICASAGLGSKDAVAARVAASRSMADEHVVLPTAGEQEDDEDAARRRRLAARAARVSAARSGEGAEKSVSTHDKQEVAEEATRPSMSGSKASKAELSDQTANSDDGQLRKIDPDDKQACTWEELHKKYAGRYSPVEIQAYWDADCKPQPKDGGMRRLRF